MFSTRYCKPLFPTPVSPPSQHGLVLNELFTPAIPVTLTSATDPQDRRHLSVIPGKSFIIGRASRTQHTDLRPAWDNALFDSQTVSRTHAELKADLSAASSDQVTIMDRDSLHGTQVNGRRLERFKPMTLRSGDLLHFGTSVTRGHGTSTPLDPLQPSCFPTDTSAVATHDGVTVIFDRAPSSPPETSQTLAANSTQLSKGFHVKVPSDSEGGSDEEDYAQSIYDEDLEHLSSAHTTPEQVKTKPGSQQHPIDVDRSVPMFPTPLYTGSNHVLPRTTVQDSIDQRAKVLVPESYPYLPGSYSLIREKLEQTSTSRNAETEAAGNAWDEDVEDNYSEVDNVHRRDEDRVSEAHGLSQADGVQDRDEENHSDADAQHRDWDVRSTRSFSVDDTAGVDKNSNRGYSDESEDEAQLGEAAFQDEEPNSYSAKKQQSPELESSVRFGTDSHNHRLDAATSTGLTNLSFTPEQPSSYNPPGLAYNQSWPFAPASVLPPANSRGADELEYDNVDPTLAIARSSKASSSSRASRRGKDNPEAFTGAISQLVNDVLEDVEAESDDEDDDLAWQMVEDALNFTKNQVAASSSTSQDLSARQKGQRDAIMEDDFPFAEHMDEDDLALARTMAAIFSDTPARPGALTGKKRKAEEMIQEEAVSDHQAVQGPPARRRRLDTPAGHSIVGSVVKYAAAAAVGGVGAFAFLLSPLSLKFIDWLQPA